MATFNEIIAQIKDCVKEKAEIYSAYYKGSDFDPLEDKAHEDNERITTLDAKIKELFNLAIVDEDFDESQFPIMSEDKQTGVRIRHNSDKVYTLMSQSKDVRAAFMEEGLANIVYSKYLDKLKEIKAKEDRSENLTPNELLIKSAKIDTTERTILTKVNASPKGDVKEQLESIMWTVEIREAHADEEELVKLQTIKAEAESLMRRLYSN